MTEEVRKGRMSGCNRRLARRDQSVIQDGLLVWLNPRE
jgi:hypothetical protein